MSLMKKFFGKPNWESDRKSVCSQDSQEEHGVSLVSVGSQTGSSLLDESLGAKCIESGLLEGIDKDYKTKCRELNSALRKYRRREEKLKRKQREVLAMENEVKELLRMSKIIDAQSTSLDEECENKKCEMSLLATIVSKEKEMEIRKREPMYYKKYNSLKNETEATNLLTLIRQRQKALQNLEVLVYQKQLDYAHDFKTDSIKQKTESVLRNRNRNFDHVFQAIKSRLDRRSEDSVTNPSLSTQNILTIAPLETPI